MQTLEIDGRRYRRQPARVPVRLRRLSRDQEVVAETLDVSTGGGAILFLDADTTCAIGDQVHLELDLGAHSAPFVTDGTVCSVVTVENADGRGTRTRIGIQFRDAFLLSQLPAEAA